MPNVAVQSKRGPKGWRTFLFKNGTQFRTLNYIMVYYYNCTTWFGFVQMPLKTGKYRFLTIDVFVSESAGSVMINSLNIIGIVDNKPFVMGL